MLLDSMNTETIKTIQIQHKVVQNNVIFKV